LIENEDTKLKIQQIEKEISKLKQELQLSKRSKNSEEPI